MISFCVIIRASVVFLVPLELVFDDQVLRPDRFDLEDSPFPEDGFVIQSSVPMWIYNDLYNKHDLMIL